MDISRIRIFYYPTITRGVWNIQNLGGTAQCDLRTVKIYRYSVTLFYTISVHLFLQLTDQTQARRPESWLLPARFHGVAWSDLLDSFF